MLAGAASRLKAVGAGGVAEFARAPRLRRQAAAPRPPPKNARRVGVTPSAPFWGNHPGPALARERLAAKRAYSCANSPYSWVLPRFASRWGDVSRRRSS